MNVKQNEHKCSVDKCFSSCIDCATVRRVKLTQMKEVGEVVAAVKRVWIGSGEDFHPEVVNS